MNLIITLISITKNNFTLSSTNKNYFLKLIFDIFKLNKNYFFKNDSFKNNFFKDFFQKIILLKVKK